MSLLISILLGPWRKPPHREYHRLQRTSLLEQEILSGRFRLNLPFVLELSKSICVATHLQRKKDIAIVNVDWTVNFSVEQKIYIRNRINITWKCCYPFYQWTPLPRDTKHRRNVFPQFNPSIVTTLLLGSPFFAADSERFVGNIYKAEAALYSGRKNRLYFLKLLGPYSLSILSEEALKGHFDVNDAVLGFFSSIKV